MQKCLENYDIFSFKTVEIGDTEKEIKSINPKQTTSNNSIPLKIPKNSSKVSAMFHINYLTIQ